MPHTDEARFIELWNAGTETAEIARQLGLKATTAQSRARRLQQQGLIQPRPRGGGYPSQKALARQDGSPATPAAPAPPAPQVAPATPAVTFVAVPEIQEILSIVKDLQARVGSLEQTRVPPALPAPPRGTRTPRGRAQGDSAVDRAPVEGPDRPPQGRRLRAAHAPEPTGRRTRLASPERPWRTDV